MSCKCLSSQPSSGERESTPLATSSISRRRFGPSLETERKTARRMSCRCPPRHSQSSPTSSRPRGLLLTTPTSSPKFYWHPRSPTQTVSVGCQRPGNGLGQAWMRRDRKSTRSELQSLMRISYAVFCLKKKKHIILTYNHKKIKNLDIP